MIKQPLNNDWNVRAVSNFGEVPSSIRDISIPASAPGCVHTDLLRAGLIDDPYFGQNEPKLFWIGRTDWQYTTYFEADPKLFDHERIDLVCDGLDTVATIVLNGSEVARTQNMHRGYRFDVRPQLKKGRNELVVMFTSPVHYAAAMRDKLGYLPGIFYGGAFNFIRKMACNFGWDWGPVVPTCGIWRGVALEGWSQLRLERLAAFTQECDTSEAIVRLAVHFDTGSDTSQLRLESSLYSDSEGAAGVVIEGPIVTSNTASWLYAVPDPKLWWPAGYGDSNLLHASVLALNFERGVSSTHSALSRRTGVRTVQLNTAPDAIGRKFVVKVNGKPIFCKGFNWIPDDCFLDRACTPERYRKRIQQAVDANANMLRVWGGGIYETDEFYDICDEMGILVWQDFLFACAAYPEAEPFKSEVEAEARYNVARLSSHPSLVLWNGCNENVWMYHKDVTDDGMGKMAKWKEQLAGKQWGQGYYFDLLPKIVNELDPSRPYWAASPWSGDPDYENGLEPNLSTHGNKHIWEVWHGPGDYNNYRWFSPRFCSEFGYQGPPNYATMKKYFDGVPPLSLSPGTPGEGRGEGQEKDEGRRMKDELESSSDSSFILHPSAFDSDPHPNPLPAYWERGLKTELRRGSPTMELHQKSPGGNARNEKLLLKDFDIPESFDDYHYLLQINQARALKTGVEWFRSRQPVCMGTLYWQLNDCYPVTSWSAIDSDGRLKPLWYATRSFYAPRLLTIQPEADALVLYANNDSDEPWKGEVVLRRMDFFGKELARKGVTIEAPSRGNLRVMVLPTSLASPRDSSREFVVVELGDAQALWFFASDRELAYPSPKLRSSFDQGMLALSSDVLIRDLVINVDRLDPDTGIDENFVTLLPGETKRFLIQSKREVDLSQLTAPPVLQCVNRFGKR